MALLGAVAEAAGLLDVMLVALAFVVGNGVRGVDIAADAHGVVEAGDDQTVTVHQFDILRGTGIGQCLVEVDAHCVDFCRRQLVECDGVTAVGTLAGNTDDLMQTGTLGLRHAALQTGSADIGSGHCPTRCLDDIGEALVLQLHSIVALIGHLALNGDADGRLEGGAHAYLNDVVGLEREAAVAVYHVVILQRETEGLGYLQACLCSRRVAQTTRYVDLGRRGGIGQSASLQDEVLDGHVVGILVGAGEDDLSVDGEGTQVLVLGDGWYEEHVLVLQGHVGRGAVEDALDIDGEHLLRAVGLHAAHHGTAAHGLFRQAAGHLQ